MIAAPTPSSAHVQTAARPFARALVVEDIAATREWLTGLVHTAFPDIGVYHAGDVRSARAWFAEHAGDTTPMLALVDLGLPDAPGSELIRYLAEHAPHARPVVSTIYDDDANLLQAMAAGAQAYLLKDRPGEELVELLRRIGGGEVALSPPMARRMLDHFRNHASFMTAGSASADAHEAQLTPRESDVLGMIGRGLTLPEAGAALGISSQTVATHVKAIYRKLGINSRAEAAMEAVRRHLT